MSAVQLSSAQQNNLIWDLYHIENNLSCSGKKYDFKEIFVIIIVWNIGFSTLLKSLVQGQKQLHTQQANNSDTLNVH